MKILVDHLPTSQKCPYSKWKPNPPCFEEPGYYYCELAKKDCNRKENQFDNQFECLCLKVHNSYINL